MWEIFLLQISLGSSYINCAWQVETISMPKMFKKIVYKIRIGETYAGIFFILMHESGILFPKLFWPTLTIFGGITRTIYSNSEGSVQFLKQNAFLTCSWRFLRFNILFKPTGKFRICHFYKLSNYCPVSNIKILFLILAGWILVDWILVLVNFQVRKCFAFLGTFKLLFTIVFPSIFTKQEIKKVSVLLLDPILFKAEN